MTRQRCGTSRCGESRMWTNTSCRYRRLHFSRHIAAVQLIPHSQVVNKNKPFVRLILLQWPRQHVSYCASALCWRVHAAITLRWLRGLVLKLFYGLIIRFSFVLICSYSLSSLLCIWCSSLLLFAGACFPCKNRSTSVTWSCMLANNERGLMRNDM